MKKTVVFLDVRSALKSEDEILRMMEPFLGGDDPIFGTRCTLKLQDFFESELIKKL